MHAALSYTELYMLLIGMVLKCHLWLTQLSFPSSSALKPGVAELQLEGDASCDDDIPKVEMGSWILQAFFGLSIAYFCDISQNFGQILGTENLRKAYDFSTFKIFDFAFWVHNQQKKQGCFLAVLRFNAGDSKFNFSKVQTSHPISKILNNLISIPTSLKKNYIRAKCVPIS